MTQPQPMRTIPTRMPSLTEISDASLVDTSLVSIILNTPAYLKCPLSEEA